MTHIALINWLFGGDLQVTGVGDKRGEPRRGTATMMLDQQCVDPLLEFNGRRRRLPTIKHRTVLGNVLRLAITVNQRTVEIRVGPPVTTDKQLSFAVFRADDVREGKADVAFSDADAREEFDTPLGELAVAMLTGGPTDGLTKRVVVPGIQVQWIQDIDFANFNSLSCL